MSIFKHQTAAKSANNQASLAELALRMIHDGVVITNKEGVIQFINPAAVTMTGCDSADSAVGLDYGLIIKIESKEGRELLEQENPLIQSMRTDRPLDPCQVCLIVGTSEKRIPVSISLLTADGFTDDRIIIFRNIAKELAEEGEQAEFISTASHEMRTPVATIDGYISLALNPQTATIDERAKGYLTAAQTASKHLGKLFQDLLDVTKLDDGKIRPRFVPTEMVDLIKSIAEGYVMRANEAKITYSFGSSKDGLKNPSRHIDQVVYSFVDIDFMHEIMDNLLDNAFKYTSAGGSIYVNVRGDGDRVLINVTDTGIGISAEDLGHIFQKFYRSDNSDTREIGGTGLGLYLVKQRVEAMGGRVWAESAFGEGSTFYVSLPRLTSDEYEKRMIAVRNQQMQAQLAQLADQPQSSQSPDPNTLQFTSVTPQPTSKISTPIQQPTSTAPPRPTTVQPPTQLNNTTQSNQVNYNINGGIK